MSSQRLWVLELSSPVSGLPWIHSSVPLSASLGFRSGLPGSWNDIDSGLPSSGRALAGQMLPLSTGKQKEFALVGESLHLRMGSSSHSLFLIHGTTVRTSEGWGPFTPRTVNSERAFSSILSSDLAFVSLPWHSKPSSIFSSALSLASYISDFCSILFTLVLVSLPLNLDLLIGFTS